ncbi:hypothetical protein DL96DRAFT_985049 [Flagelloscypha sp. PMI_526]|nr:hypothetical protein DL96DRAFT_985049 [Flagelloscypha sp. PMI_526]
MANPPASIVTIAGPPLLGFFFNLLLSGVLIVQVYLYYIGFPNDRVRIKVLVYAVFILEMLQTGIQCYDKFNLYGKEFGDVANLDKGRLSWFSISILASFTGGIVQAFLGWKIYTLSQNLYIAIGVWMLTLLATGAGMAQGILVNNIPISQIATHVRDSLNVSTPHVPRMPSVLCTLSQIWFITTAINDFIIAGILTFYLHRMRSGVKSTDKAITRIIRLTVETGSITALGAIVIVITYFVAPPWFLVISDCIGKLYANNLMVMFNRRLTITHQTALNSFKMTQCSTLRAVAGDPDLSLPTSSDIEKRFTSGNDIKPASACVLPSSEWVDTPCTEYVTLEPIEGPELQR